MTLQAKEDRTGVPARPDARQIGTMFLVSLLICAVWFSVVCSANIRFDTDRMFYSAETAVSQYRRENRSGLAFLLNLFTGGGWDPVLNGALFLLFFVLSCWILWLYLIRFTEGKWQPVWYLLFTLLYGTSPVWAFQFYFSLQAAPVGFGIMLAAAFAGTDVRMHTGEAPKPVALTLWEAAALLCTCFLTVIYQSLIIYYAAAAAMLLFCRLAHGTRCRVSMILLWAARIVLALAAYVMMTHLAPGGQSGYLSGQIQWGKQPVLTCLSNILVEFGKTLLMAHSSHFSLYLPGMILLAVFLVRRKREGNGDRWIWLLLTAAALVLLPMAMSIFQASRPVPRTQFALQVISAFLIVFFAAECISGQRAVRVVRIVCFAAVIIQAVLVLRLGYTDNRRNRWDLNAAERIIQDIREKGLEGQPLVFTGTLPFEDDTILMEKTDVFGLSMFEWSYDPEKPCSATSGAVRLLSAANGKAYKAKSYQKILNEIRETAEQMVSFPEDGYIRPMDGYVIIRLPEEP